MAIKSPNAATCSPNFTLWLIVEIVIILTAKYDSSQCQLRMRDDVTYTVT